MNVKDVIITMSHETGTKKKYCVLHTIRTDRLELWIPFHGIQEYWIPDFFVSSAWILNSSCY